MRINGMRRKVLGKVKFWWSAAGLVVASWTNLKLCGQALGSGVSPFGRVHFLITDRRGEVVFDGWHPNLVVTSGKNHIADQLASNNEAAMSHMAIGTGTTTADSTNTALQSELDRNVLASKTQGTGGEANKVTYICTWAAGDGTGAIAEAGIFNSAAAGTMLSRAVFPVKNKETAETMTMTWILTIAS